MERACQGRTPTGRKVGKLPVMWQNKEPLCQGLRRVTMQHHNADNSTTFLGRLYVAAHKIKTYAYARAVTHCKAHGMLLHACFSQADSSLTFSLSHPHTDPN